MTSKVGPGGVGVDLNIWLGRWETPYEDPDFARLAQELCRLQEVVAGSHPPSDIARAAASAIAELSSAIEPYEVDEATQPSGRQLSEPGRGQTMLPPVYVDGFDAAGVRGRVTFSRFYLGSNGAAHGGAIALLFDDLLGQLANVPGSPRARTAYLHIDFRRIVPLAQVLDVVGSVSRIEGRKVFITGELQLNGQVLSQAAGLFVRLGPDQP